MAKISPIHGEMSGSIAGNTWSHNKGGQYVRQRRIPTNPNATKQQAARTLLATLSGNWAALTTTQQGEWDNWGAINPVVDALGLTFNRSGQQAFVGLNARLIGAGGSVSVTPPVTTAPDQLASVSAVATSPSTIAVTFTATPLGAGERLYLWQTLPGSAGRNPNFNQARLVGYSAAAGASPATFTSPYPGLVNQQSNLYVGRMDANGQISVPQKLRVTYV